MLYDGADAEVVAMLRRINAVTLMFCAPPLATPDMIEYYQRWEAQSWQWRGKPGAGLCPSERPHCTAMSMTLLCASTPAR